MTKLVSFYFWFYLKLCVFSVYTNFYFIIHCSAKNRTIGWFQMYLVLRFEQKKTRNVLPNKMFVYKIDFREKKAGAELCQAQHSLS